MLRIGKTGVKEKEINGNKKGCGATGRWNSIIQLYIHYIVLFRDCPENTFYFRGNTCFCDFKLVKVRDKLVTVQIYKVRPFFASDLPGRRHKYGKQ